MTPDVLRERVAAHQLSDIEQVSDSVIRFTKKAGDSPFAVYYIDSAGEIPLSQELLTKYLDRVIGPHYFEGRRSLQWSNYLYFLTEKELLETKEARRARELIECDRYYARKFVITEDDLDSVLESPITMLEATPPHANVLSVWTEELTRTGLDRAVFSSDSLPARIRLIEQSKDHAVAPQKSPKPSLSTLHSPFIRSLELKDYLPFPSQRMFEFGTVNLVFGANGTGKTSLLEAIELFYCGRNKRNPDSSYPYQLAVLLADGRPEVATGDRRLQESRDRNLAWYAQSEVKTNNLYQSFARFNFLDTDAAVSLAESASRLEDDLSKLLVGPDASKVWRDIERLCGQVDAKLREYRAEELPVKAEIGSLERQLISARGIMRESDSIRNRLEMMIQRIRGATHSEESQAFATDLVASLSELTSLLQQATSLAWLESPISIDVLDSYCRRARDLDQSNQPIIARLEYLDKNGMSLTNTISQNRCALELAKRAKRAIDAGVPGYTAELERLDEAISRQAVSLSGLDADISHLLSNLDVGVSVSACHQDAAKCHSEAAALLATAKADYSSFSRQRDDLQNLGQELRQLASEALESSSNPDECPLCHTVFGSGQLVTRINAGLDEHLEKHGQTLLAQLHQSEETVHNASRLELASAWLQSFCKRVGLNEPTVVGSALAEVDNMARALAEGQAQAQSVKQKLDVLESQGLSHANLDNVVNQLIATGYPLRDYTGAAVDTLLLALDDEMASLSPTLESERTEAETLSSRVAASLDSSDSDMPSLKATLSQLREQLTRTDTVRARIESFSTSFPWPRQEPLVSCLVEVEAIRSVAVELQAALGKEGQADSICSNATSRKANLEQKLHDLHPRVKRLKEARSELRRLMSEHSLEAAMASTLQENRAGIERIFASIHSPAEFAGLGSCCDCLERKNGGEARLSEISTGQRAAFALSIFLSQNAQLVTAPPVVLIDDPVAHIDDLNSLSFLDYLREVALTGRRQIFFATASAKLAALFERKFDFMGDRFRRFDLTR